MGDTAINVPVRVRTHELQQFHEFVPDVIGGLRQAEMDEEADTMERIYDEHISGVEPTYPEDSTFAAYVSMPAEDWKDTIRYVGRLQFTDASSRAWWLRTKLVDRLEDRLEEME